MKKTVVLTTCDQCHKESIIDVPKANDRQQYVLPEGWIHVQGDTKTSTVFALDLCEECVGPILALAGKHK